MDKQKQQLIKKKNVAKILNVTQGIHYDEIFLKKCLLRFSVKRNVRATSFLLFICSFKLKQQQQEQTEK